MTKTISLLGSTGSIGRQTLQVARELGLPILARLPIDPAVAQACDHGLMETVDTSVLKDAVAAVEKA